MSKSKGSARKASKKTNAGKKDLFAHREARAYTKDESGVAVAVDGDDSGTKERYSKARPVSHDGDAIWDFMIGDVSSAIEAVDGKPRRVKKVRDILDAMKDNGTISDDEEKAGRLFQLAFLVAHKENVGAVDFSKLSSAGGKGCFLDVKLAARRRLDEYYDLLGGKDSVSSRAMTHIIGYGFTLNDMIRNFSHGAHVWRGALMSALPILLAHEKKKRSRKTKGGK